MAGGTVRQTERVSTARWNPMEPELNLIFLKKPKLSISLLIFEKPCIEIFKGFRSHFLCEVPLVRFHLLASYHY
jgi:hypothetical protein